MSIEINMINVEDGDAIIVVLKKQSKNAVIVIDGGRKKYYDDRLNRRLKEVLKENGKEGPDLVVCTHYDADHIAGILELVEEYGNKIKRIWIHKHPVDIRKQIEFLEQTKAHVNQERNIIPLYGSEFLEKMTLNNLSWNDCDLIIESLNQLEKLYDILQKPDNRTIAVEHPTTGKTLIGWDEFRVEGPTKDYLEECFKNFKDKVEFFVNESIAESTLTEEERLSLYESSEVDNPDPCKYLAKKSKISATNKSSIICSVVGDKGKYLFTGDAGIESFEAIPNWERELKDLFWLDVPHHGSWNNTSKEMIEVMKPKYAWVSGDGGTNRPDEKVKACLEDKGAQVYITNEYPPSTWYLKHDGDKDFDRIPD